MTTPTEDAFEMSSVDGGGELPSIFLEASRDQLAIAPGPLHISIPTTLQDDELLRQVTMLPGLVTLYIYPPLSSAGARHLHNAVDLKNLMVWEGPPAIADVVALLEALPNLENVAFDHVRERYGTRESVERFLARLRDFEANR